MVLYFESLPSDTFFGIGIIFIIHIVSKKLVNNDSLKVIVSGWEKISAHFKKFGVSPGPKHFEELTEIYKLLK